MCLWVAIKDHPSWVLQRRPNGCKQFPAGFISPALAVGWSWFLCVRERLSLGCACGFSAVTR